VAEGSMSVLIISASAAAAARFADPVKVAQLVGLAGQRCREAGKVGAAVADGQATVDLDGRLDRGERFAVAAHLCQRGCLPQLACETLVRACRTRRVGLRPAVLVEVSSPGKVSCG
jgi:hypothetical protein